MWVRRMGWQDGFAELLEKQCHDEGLPCMGHFGGAKPKQNRAQVLGAQRLYMRTLLCALVLTMLRSEAAASNLTGYSAALCMGNRSSRRPAARFCAPCRLCGRGTARS